MDINSDHLDEIFGDEARKNARPVGKFQPKSKFRPPAKKSSPAAPAASSEPVQTIDAGRNELSSEPVTTANQSKHDEVPNGNGVAKHATVGKSAGENSDISTGVEALGESSSQRATTSGAEPVTADVANPENPTNLDPLTFSEPTISTGDGCIENTCLGREEFDVMDSINMSELTTQSGQTTRKFQPKPKIQMQEELLWVSKSVSCSLGSQSVAPEISIPEKDPYHIQQDDVLDLSDLGFSHNLPTEEHYDLPLNEESLNVMDTTQSDSGIHLRGVPEIPAKLTSWRAKTGPSETAAASDPSPSLKNAPVSDLENGNSRSLRPRKGKTNFCELEDEDDGDEVLASEDFSEQGSVGSALEEENGINEESQEENESQSKKVKRKLKKSHVVEEKPAKKGKKAKDSSNQDKEAKPKKFSHSTRRRRVNKALLETPEDEIDYQRVPLRDLILLAEYKERQAKKEEAAAVPATNQSNANPSHDYNEDENFTSRQDGEYDDGQEAAEVEDSTVYFNYQTYMDKTPKARWSKQDTELFYEAVRQFGTDLSMIQQLFPERTRRQVKLKYKKEERQHPFRLNEALTNFSKEDFHFQTVIKRLKKVAEENQKADQDESIDLTGDEVADEGTTSNADVEEAKSEHEDERERERVVEEKNEDLGNDPVQVENPLESDDVEDDMLIWSQYKSDS